MLERLFGLNKLAPWRKPKFYNVERAGGDACPTEEVTSYKKSINLNRSSE